MKAASRDVSGQTEDSGEMTEDEGVSYQYQAWVSILKKVLPGILHS